MLQALLPLIGNVIDRVVPDKNANAKAKREIEKSLVENANELLLAQTEINKVEAGHRSLFVAGWRPCIGWICASSLGFNFILAPCLEWYIAFAQLDITLPTISLNELYPVILGMLGLGFARSYEKIKNVSK